jgi:N-acyl-D-amino-acid deacylase
MATSYDPIIRGAILFDRTGSPRFNADIAVTGDRIIAVGNLGGHSGAREIIASCSWISMVSPVRGETYA